MLLIVSLRFIRGESYLSAAMQSPGVSNRSGKDLERARQHSVSYLLHPLPFHAFRKKTSFNIMGDDFQMVFPMTGWLPLLPKFNGN